MEEKEEKRRRILGFRRAWQSRKLPMFGVGEAKKKTREKGKEAHGKPRLGRGRGEMESDVMPEERNTRYPPE